MSRKPVPPAYRKVHLLTGEVTACGRHKSDPAVAGYTTGDPDAVTCGNCLRETP